MTATALEPNQDAEEFFLNPSEWNEEMAPELARQVGIATLNATHWKVIRTMRKEFEENGSGPNVRALSKISGITIKELYELFPGGPAKTAAKIAGIPKPHGCI